MQTERESQEVLVVVVLVLLMEVQQHLGKVMQAEMAQQT